MLARTILHEEVGMSEQRLLFELHPLPWVESLWRKVDSKRRREVVSLLAEMGRAALGARRQVRKEERGHES